ncbi:hypothetical protein JTE90_012302 [Oedothorax gibbosus]|uniref:Uncharacterized protein n=1 Tax=Oedothorax gibbosus TaxID=931172 RepID=A0AAV6VI59_9ARAC|nr:hypothetical protein JTE90_012302 [Oedothorax gibbosus]
MVKSRKKENFWNFLASVLQNSMLTGIPQIASAGNAPKKLVRALVFVMCLVGFVYQSLEFMNIYWRYETVIDVKVESPRVIDMPALTVCNYNGIMNSKVCIDPDRCSNMTDENTEEFWCKCFPRYCDWGRNLPLVPMPSFVSETLWHLTLEEMAPYLQTWEEMLAYCTLVMADKERLVYNCPQENTLSIRCPTDQPLNMNVCFTLFSNIGQPGKKPKQVLSTGFMNLVLEPLTYEYPAYLIRESMEVSFHSPRGIISPYENGFTMTTASKNIYHLKKTVKHLLPPPYETNCFDYISAWEARGGWGPTTERECIEECKVNESMKIFGCISNMFISPSNEMRCLGMWGNNADEQYKLKELTSNVIKCSEEKCKPACYEETYQVVKDSTDFMDEPDCHAFNRGDRPEQKILIQMNFDGMETTTYTYSPKFQNIETFSYLGGYVGMWLGISLVAVFDFLETIMLMMKYPFRRFVLYKQRQNRITNLKKLQRTV